MDTFFSRNRDHAVLAAVLLGQLLGLGYQVRRPDARGIRLAQLWALEAVLPVERASQHIVGDTRGLVQNYVALREVRRQNATLKQQVAELELERQRLSAAVRDLPRLDALLQFQRTFGVRTVAAQVIGSGASADSQVLYLDRGANAGLARNMAVITPDGVVGKISQVVGSSATVLLLTDPVSGAGVLIGSGGAQGVLRGLGPGRVEVQGILNGEPVAAGAQVLTSGEDQVFPKGLLVGAVTGVGKGPVFEQVDVRLAADLNRVEEVLVITATLPPPVPEVAPGETAAALRQALLPSIPAAGLPHPMGTVPPPNSGQGGVTAAPGADTPPLEGDAAGGAPAPAPLPAHPAPSAPAARSGGGGTE